MNIDFDLSELEEIGDPELRSIMKRVTKYGFATFRNDKISNKISRAASSLRKSDPPWIIFSNDRRADYNVISINDNVMNIEKAIEAAWKDLIKELK